MKTPMTAQHRIALAAAALSLAVSGAASATTTLGNEYTVSSTATNLGGSVWQFDYTVLNNNQGIGGQTGFDGLTLLIPTSATIVSSSAPAPLNGWPGYWSTATVSTLDLGGNGSQSLTAPSGYTLLSWWGQYTQSVYTPGSTASFSITLSNVSAGTNSVGLSTYFGYGTPTAAAATNQYGNYSTFIGDFKSPVAAVPEPETYGMMLAGLGLLGVVTRRKKANGKAA